MVQIVHLLSFPFILLRYILYLSSSVFKFNKIEENAYDSVGVLICHDFHHTINSIEYDILILHTL